MTPIMPMTRRLALATSAAALTIALAACGGPTSSAAHNDADTDFAQGMLVHHRGALDMAEMAPSRAGDPRVKDLAERITAAQEPEIDQMTSWLEDWDEKVPAGSGGMEGMKGMGAAGMMSEKDMDRMRSTSGASFDEAWLRGMTVHHRGAVDMAKTEIADGENPEAVALAKTITKDQKAEIEEMEQILQG